MAEPDTTKPEDQSADPTKTLQDATEQAQAEIQESVRKQESVVYAAARAKVGSDNQNPPIDGDERTRTLTIADMNNAPTGIMPGLPGGQNPLAQALAKGDEDVSAAVEQVAAAQAASDAVPDGVQDANAAAAAKPAKKAAPALPQK